MTFVVINVLMKAAAGRALKAKAKKKTKTIRAAARGLTAVECGG